MREHLAGAVEVETQRAKQPCRHPQVPVLVVEGHAVQVEAIAHVAPHDAGVEPSVKDPRGVLVLVEPAGLVACGKLDVDGVVGTERGKPGSLDRVNDVVGRRHDRVGIHAGRVVADGGERF